MSSASTQQMKYRLAYLQQGGQSGRSALDEQRRRGVTTHRLNTSFKPRHSKKLHIFCGRGRIMLFSSVQGRGQLPVGASAVQRLRVGRAPRMIFIFSFVEYALYHFVRRVLPCRLMRIAKWHLQVQRLSAAAWWRADAGGGRPPSACREPCEQQSGIKRAAGEQQPNGQELAGEGWRRPTSIRQLTPSPSQPLCQTPSTSAAAVLIV